MSLIAQGGSGIESDDANAIHADEISISDIALIFHQPCLSLVRTHQVERGVDPMMNLTPCKENHCISTG